MSNNYKYYLCIGNGWGYGFPSSKHICIILNTDSNTGSIINGDGTRYGSSDNWGQRWIDSLQKNQTKLSTLKECLNTVPPEYKSNFKKVLNELKIKLNETPIVIADETIKSIQETLTAARAFNGDSAFFVGGDDLQEICAELAERKLIKTLDYQKYWVEQEN